MYKKYIIVVVIILSGIACNPYRKIKVINVNTEENIEKVALFYSLPRTTLRFHVTAERTMLKKGPFADYAEKYMSITPVIEEDDVIWKISNVEVETLLDADPDEFYGVCLPFRRPDLSLFLTLSKEGLIALLNPYEVYSSNIYTSKDTTSGNQVYFKDVSILPSFCEVKDTLYKTLFMDSIFVRVPVWRTFIEQKDMETKAEEAANHVLEIRKSKFELLAGHLDYTPEGNALDICVRELERLEEEYLSLFIGKSSSETFNYIIEYIPIKDNNFQTGAIFRFSESYGVLPLTSKLGTPVNLALHTNTDYLLQKKLEEQITSSFKGSIIYRIPEQVNVKVLNGGEELFTGRVLISQFGMRATMPLGVIR